MIQNWHEFCFSLVSCKLKNKVDKLSCAQNLKIDCKKWLQKIIGQLQPFQVNFQHTLLTLSDRPKIIYKIQNDLQCNKQAIEL